MSQLRHIIVSNLCVSVLLIHKPFHSCQLTLFHDFLEFDPCRRLSCLRVFQFLDNSSLVDLQPLQFACRVLNLGYFLTLLHNLCMADGRMNLDLLDRSAPHTFDFSLLYNARLKLISVDWILLVFRNLNQMSLPLLLDALSNLKRLLENILLPF